MRAVAITVRFTSRQLYGGGVKLRAVCSRLLRNGRPFGTGSRHIQSTSGRRSGTGEDGVDGEGRRCRASGDVGSANCRRRRRTALQAASTTIVGSCVIHHAGDVRPPRRTSAIVQMVLPKMLTRLLLLLLALKLVAVRRRRSDVSSAVAIVRRHVETRRPSRDCACVRLRSFTTVGDVY